MEPQGRRRRNRFIRTIVLALVLLSGAGFILFRYERPLPALTVVVSRPTYTRKEVPLPWTPSGESAISTASNIALGQGPNATKVVPTASIAKLITILTVLKKYPLNAGESGPTITLTSSDVDRYSYYLAVNGSTAAVAAGEHITEYQMFQAMMLPSANNMADSLAIWAYGSLAAYRTVAQNTVTQLGMTHTTVGSDASGFLPDTTSTANDLIVLGRAALTQGVITEIAAQTSARIPVAGTIYTTNPDLSSSGITGLKTGTSDQAGDCFLFSATHTFNNGHIESFVGVILNAATSESRFTDATALLAATYDGYKDQTIAKAGRPIGTITSAWGQNAMMTPAQDVSVFEWQGDSSVTAPIVSLRPLMSAVKKGQSVGSITGGTSASQLVATRTITAPSVWWRITH